MFPRNICNAGQDSGVRPSSVTDNLRGWSGYEMLHLLDTILLQWKIQGDDRKR